MKKYIRIALILIAALPTWTAAFLGITGLVFSPLIGLTFLAAATIVVWFTVDTIRGAL